MPGIPPIFDESDVDDSILDNIRDASEAYRSSWDYTDALPLSILAKAFKGEL